MSLRVEEAYDRDNGWCKARIDMDAMEELSWTRGEYIKIETKDRKPAASTFARCLPLYPYEPKNIIRIDARIRHNAGNIGIGEEVHIMKARTYNATHIELLPMQDLPFEGGTYMSDYLDTFPIRTGDIVQRPYRAGYLFFKITGILPKSSPEIDEVAVVMRETQFTIQEKHP